jgi:hypothetical protein
MLELQAIAAVHVIPVGAHVDVTRPVDLDSQLGLLPDRVEPSPAAMRVAQRYLPIGCWQFELAHYEPREIEFGQGVGTARYVADGICQPA